MPYASSRLFELESRTRRSESLVPSVFTGGSVRFDNEAFRRQLTQLAEELDVSDAVAFEGETSDICSALNSIDVLLVPSWFEPFGRVVVEGMAAGVPVVATLVGGRARSSRTARTGFWCSRATPQPGRRRSFRSFRTPPWRGQPPRAAGTVWSRCSRDPHSESSCSDSMGDLPSRLPNRKHRTAVTR